ncbi:hypothetical protein GOBAR_DD17388 [Gossypium barbadense]|nr:hypothetical protein GOBAR_DD17388 [Gossypium barbadense]
MVRTRGADNRIVPVYLSSPILVKVGRALRIFTKKEPTVNEDVAPTTMNNNVALSDDEDQGADVTDRDNMP